MTQPGDAGPDSSAALPPWLVRIPVRATPAYALRLFNVTTSTSASRSSRPVNTLDRAGIVLDRAGIVHTRRWAGHRRGGHPAPRQETRSARAGLGCRRGWRTGRAGAERLGQDRGGERRERDVYQLHGIQEQHHGCASDRRRGHPSRLAILGARRRPDPGRGHQRGHSGAQGRRVTCNVLSIRFRTQPDQSKDTSDNDQRERTNHHDRQPAAPSLRCSQPRR
jgi:hypothetical protein